MVNSKSLRERLATDIFHNKENLPPNNPDDLNLLFLSEYGDRSKHNLLPMVAQATNSSHPFNDPAAKATISQIDALRSARRGTVPNRKAAQTKLRKTRAVEVLRDRFQDEEIDAIDMALDTELQKDEAQPRQDDSKSRDGVKNKAPEGLLIYGSSGTEDEDDESSIEELDDESAYDFDFDEMLLKSNPGSQQQQVSPSESDTRLAQLTNEQLKRKWRRIKKEMEKQEAENAALLEKQAPVAAKSKRYIRPDRTVQKIFSKTTTKLFRHLRLVDDDLQPTSKVTERIFTWLQKEDSLLHDRIALVAPRMEFPHIQEVYQTYEEVRPVVLKYLREKFKNSGWCMLFSEYIHIDYRHKGVQGSCLFLMIDTEDTRRLTRAIKRMLFGKEYYKELAVVVRKGKPRLFGSYSMPRDSSEEGEEEEEEIDFKTDRRQLGPTTSGFSTTRWLNPFHTSKAEVKTAPPPPLLGISAKPIRKSMLKIPSTRKNSKVVSWEPSPTPPPLEEVPNVIRLISTKSHPITEAHISHIHYGLQWITALGIPAADEGVNTKYEVRPNIGASLGNQEDSGSGTLAGYLNDGKGNIYGMTCHHVMYFNDESINPISSNFIKGDPAFSPSNIDLEAVTMGLAHEIDGLNHEVRRSVIRGEKLQVKLNSLTGRNKINSHDRCVKALEEGGAEFGEVVASSWKIAHTDEGPMIMDQVLIKPDKNRIGTNTFTYVGRDNKFGKRYRLEARGWAEIPLGGDVLKIGRTTGLTRGTIIALAADLRLCVGEDKNAPPGEFINHFWEIRTGVITNGAGPWFSDPGDSGAWVLHCPTWEEMQSWDLRRRKGKKTAEPVPAPVGGMMFGGADCVEGISLTFYNPTRLIRRYLAAQFKGGEKLTPGLGAALPEPAELEYWTEQEVWSEKSKYRRKLWQDFVSDELLGHYRDRYPKDHRFRRPEWEHSWGPDAKDDNTLASHSWKKGGSSRSAHEKKDKGKGKETDPPNRQSPGLKI